MESIIGTREMSIYVVYRNVTYVDILCVSASD